VVRVLRHDRANLLEVRHEALLVGYARCSTDQQDLTAQRDALSGLGVEADRTYVDHGLTGTNRERPGLREALAACRAGDTLVVTKLDRLARSLPDARAIADELTARQISLSLGGSVYDPTDAVGRLLFNVLTMVAEFGSDLIRLRTVEGMKVAKAKGRLRGKQPKLNRRQEAHLVSLVHSGEYSTLEVAELFGVGRSTVYRAIERQRVEARAGLARGRHRSIDSSSRRRPSRVRHPSGTPASRHCRMCLSALMRFGLRTRRGHGAKRCCGSPPVASSTAWQSALGLARSLCPAGLQRLLGTAGAIVRRIEVVADHTRGYPPREDGRQPMSGSGPPTKSSPTRPPQGRQGAALHPVGAL